MTEIYKIDTPAGWHSILPGARILSEPKDDPRSPGETAPCRPIDEALAQLSIAIVDMAVLTDDESEALDAVLEPALTTGDEPGPPLPVSKLAEQIARHARRIEDCNAYRRARLARIDLPRG
jgi:hypothetical protein